VVVVTGGRVAVRISIFATRVANTGVDRVPLLGAAAQWTLLPSRNTELAWASPRELLKVFHTDSVGCHITTVTNNILKPLDMVSKDLDELSLDTVKRFCRDALEAGFRLELRPWRPLGP
jgi:transaldolase